MNLMLNSSKRLRGRDTEIRFKKEKKSPKLRF